MSAEETHREKLKIDKALMADWAPPSEGSIAEELRDASALGTQMTFHLASSTEDRLPQTNRGSPVATDRNGLRTSPAFFDRPVGRPFAAVLQPKRN